MIEQLTQQHNSSVCPSQSL